jgi:hypothetical protein
MKTKKKYSIQRHSTKKTKTKKLKTKQKLNKTSNTTCYDINKIVHQIEFDILFTTITIQILFLIHIKTPNYKIKKEIIKLLKDIRNNNKLITNTITDDELNLIYERIYNYSIKLHKEIQESKKNKTTQTQLKQSPSTHIHITQSQPKPSLNNKTRGGFFFKDLESKGDEPITGNDIVKFLDEIDSFVYNAQWTDEGEFLRNPYTLFNILRGNVDAFKTYVNWHVLPKYYQIYPPFLKWTEADGSGGIKDIITRKWEDIPDYLLAYKTYTRLQNEYLVSQGLKSPAEVLGDNNFFTKFANKLDTSIQKFQGIRRKFEGIKSGKFTLQMPL